ncbi:MAG TPA: N-acetylmuramoyl-L-alanine amidase-like domain-containing protein, partial [Thermoanaerobaculia bacterium]|nr:N-acetylmuramoyl-L-alanine amidase-like domain-containing protein [Thermoanaerobaculia bacterium]
DAGRVEWKRRNHYMTGWIRANARLGVVRPVFTEAHATRKERVLDLVPGLPPKRTRFACVPKARLKALRPKLKTGDLIFFASTRPRLDVFHCGILVNGGERWRLRHAARSRKSVVETDLDEFLKANRMAGVIVVRPVVGPGSSN